MSATGPIPGILGAASRPATGLPRNLPVRVGPGLDVAPGAILITIPKIARYLVRNGTSVDVEVEDGADADAVALFLDSIARGALIYQRGEVALEATTIQLANGICIAICGASSIGKSTLAATFINRGAKLVADGITRITLSGGRPTAWPSHSALKLWHDCCERLAIETTKLQRVRQGLEKFVVPVPAETNPVALKVIVKLRPGTHLEAVEVPEERRGEIIADSIFRRLLMEAMAPRGAIERTFERMAASCRVFSLTGGRDYPADDVADCLTEALL